LRDSWVEDLEDSDDFFFGASSNGWSNDAFGLKWLTDVFEPNTAETAGRGKRLLIVDGHSSHINMAFINKCWDLRIILLVLPPHSTHRLQPLDVVLFGLLVTAYSNELNAFMAKSLGITSMKKRHFLPLFRAAWRTSFTVENIQHAFEKPGIWPVNPKLVLNVITRPTTPPQAIEASSSSSRALKTPWTVKSIRHFQASYRKNPTAEKLAKLFKANEELSAQVSLDQYTKEGLIESLKLEKKCRNRGEKLNILGKENNGPILFSAENVRLAQTKAAEKEEKEKAERVRIDSNKVAAATKKAQKDALQAEKGLQAATRKDNLEEVRAEEKAEKQAQKRKETLAKKASKAVPAVYKSPAKPRKAPIRKKKAVQFINVDAMGVVASATQKRTTSGRVVKQPRTFEQGQ